MIKPENKKEGYTQYPFGSVPNFAITAGSAAIFVTTGNKEYKGKVHSMDLKHGIITLITDNNEKKELDENQIITVRKIK